MKELLLFVVMLVNVPGVSGQEALSLDDCRRLAIQNNKKLKMADEQVKTGIADYWITFSRIFLSTH